MIRGLYSIFKHCAFHCVACFKLLHRWRCIIVFCVFPPPLVPPSFFFFLLVSCHCLHPSCSPYLAYPLSLLPPCPPTCPPPSLHASPFSSRLLLPPSCRVTPSVRVPHSSHVSSVVESSQLFLLLSNASAVSSLLDDVPCCPPVCLPACPPACLPACPLAYPPACHLPGRMLHGVRFTNGRASYVCRYVRTSRVQQEGERGGPVFLKVFPPCQQRSGGRASRRSDVWPAG